MNARKLGCALLGCLLGVGVMELAVRRVYDITFVDEPGIGEVISPGQTVRWGREGHAISHWTEHGVRRPEPPDPEKKSVLVLGDSFTEALMVSDDDVYTTRAERDLKTRGHTLQVLNAGRSSCSLADYIHLAPTYERLFHPSWTVLELRAEDLGSEAWMQGRTHFFGEGGLHVMSVSPPVRTGLRKLWWDVRQRSMFVAYVAVRMGELRRAASEEPPLFLAGSFKPTAPVDDESAYPVEAEIDAAVTAFHGHVTFLYLADYDPAHPTEARSAIERRLFSHCASKGLSCANTRAEYGSLPARGVAPFGFPNTKFNFGHMNEIGHAIAGRVLAAELARQIEHAVF